MRFMLIAKADKDAQAGALPKPELMAAIEQLTKEMTNAGVLLDGGGLAPNSTVTGVGDGVAVVRLSGGRVTVTDGPFAEAKELIGGYAIVEAASEKEAIGMAERFLELHREILGDSYEMDSEVRRFYGPLNTVAGSAPQ